MSEFKKYRNKKTGEEVKVTRNAPSCEINNSYMVFMEPPRELRHYTEYAEFWPAQQFSNRFEEVKDAN